MVREESRVICIDFHGTLSNGVMNIAHDGTMFESVCVRDIRAVRQLVASGFEVYVVTQSNSKIIDSYCSKVGCEKIVLRDKAAIPFDNYIAIGDDVPDVPMLTKAAKAYVPADADESVKNIPGVKVLRTKGGEGVVSELLTLLIA